MGDERYDASDRALERVLARRAAASAESDAALALVMRRRVRNSLFNAPSKTTPRMEEHTDKGQRIDDRYSIAPSDAILGTPAFLLSSYWDEFAGIVVAANSIFEAADRYYRNHALIGSTPKPSKHKDYSQALACLAGTLDHEPVIFRALDRHMKGWASVMFQEDPAAGRRQRLCNAIFGSVHRAPALRDHLPMTRRVLAGWKTGLPSRGAHWDGPKHC